ncbi:Zinc finger protein 2 [Frankliniella fusca]|uniref:Zinc finger protein 2 n=1 Tax=Frankliniella fusca TaxID=407009 RepID=A0AAE1LNG5_9NEOP|nr:Zinc finger protein 2 [Frankliniella fusca]
MELSISCPLCSQPGFSDVNSLWLSLIRVTTRQLTCPVCQDVLSGLDKLTIHLVSHSLHDQLVQACLSPNMSISPSTLSKGMEINKVTQCAESIPLPKPVTATSTQPLENSALPSYVFVNFPTFENVLMKERAHAAVSGNVGLPVVKENTPYRFMSSPKPEYPLVLMAKADDNTSATDNNPSMTPVLGQSTGVFSLNVSSQNPCPQLPQQEPSKLEETLNHQTSQIPKEEPHSQVSDSAICCQVCGLTFKDNNIAMLHQQLIHHQSPPGENYQVLPKSEDRPHCSKQRSRRGNVLNQQRDGALHRFPCHICNKVFRMRGSLMVHIRVAHTPNGTIGLASKLRSVSTALNSQSDVTSKLCLQNLSIKETTLSFSADETISDDCQERCKNKSLAVPKPTELSPPSSSPTFSYKLNSILPDKKLSSDQNTLENVVTTMVVCPTKCPPSFGQTESPGIIFPCNLCNKTYSKETLLLQHLKSHDSKQWECDVCFKSFTTKYFLKKHKRLHTGEMPYTCGICNKSFTFQQSYHKHLLYHSDDKPHTCTECGRAFKELSTLHNHQRIHTGEKPWACESCGKCFRQRVSYLVHRRIHTGAMPYQCTVCFKSFRYKVSQRTHKCVVQPSSDIASPPADLLQQLLESPRKEIETDGLLQDVALAGNINDRLTSLKDHLPHPPANKAYSLPTKDEANNQFTLESKDSSQLPSNSKCSNVEIESSFTHQLSLACHNICNDSQSGVVSPFPSIQRSEEISKAITSPIAKPELQLEKDCAIPRESQVDVSVMPHSTPPSSSDFNIDLLQDILSMVMSPSDSAPSPSTQMRHLSLTGGQNDEDFESGLELRQLLYGPCDSDTI